MPFLSLALRRQFAQTKIVVLPEDYFVVRLPVDAKPLPGEWYRPTTTRFAVFIREPEQITLIVPRRKWLRMHNIFDEFKLHGPMKVIVFDTKLSMVAPGYMATIGSVLAEAKLSVMPISSFQRDHVLVEKADLPRTVRILRQFLQNLKS
jgi:hypothetical protein